MKHLIYIFLCMTIVGCASTTDSSAAKQTDNAQVKTVAAATKETSKEKPKEQLICKSEKKLGSNHRTRICRPKDNAHDTAIRSQELMNDLGAGR